MTIGAGLLLGACTSKPKENNRMKTEIEKKADEFVSFKLTTDLSVLTEKEKQMLPHLFQAAQIMNEIFWMEAFGDKEEVLAKATSPAMEKFIESIMDLGNV